MNALELTNDPQEWKLFVDSRSLKAVLLHNGTRLQSHQRIFLLQRGH